MVCRQLFADSVPHVHLPRHREKRGVVCKPSLGVLKMSTTNKNKPPLSPEHCRRFALEGMQEFEHFIKTLLSEVQPGRTGHEWLRGQEPISKCFSASDKAFALTVLDKRRMHTWAQQIKKRKGSS